MKGKKAVIRVIVGLAVFFVLAGAAIYAGLRIKMKEKQPEAVHEGIAVVILDSGSYYYSDEGIDKGMKLAMEELEKESGLKVSVKRVDDDGDYVKGIALAESLAKDPEVDIVISFQNFESIGPEMPFFEEAGKPFIVTMGCYDEVAEQEYDYFVADFLSGKAIGRRIGRYLLENGASNIALCHSDTTFEQDEIRGLQAVVGDDEKTKVVYTQTGPFQDEELAGLLWKCDQLQVDTVVANFYDQEDCAWLLGQLGQKSKGLMLVGDYALDSEGILKEYGSNLENVTIIPSYPYLMTEELAQFINRYEEYAKTGFTTAAVQYYDLFKMLGKYWQKTGNDSQALMKQIKDPAGYRGVSGSIRFDENGCLTVKECPVYECHNGEFIPKE